MWSSFTAKSGGVEIFGNLVRGFGTGLFVGGGSGELLDSLISCLSSSLLLLLALRPTGLGRGGRGIFLLLASPEVAGESSGPLGTGLETSGLSASTPMGGFMIGE